MVTQQQQEQQIDPAIEAWAKHLDAWLETDEGKKELERWEARIEAEEMYAAAHEWDTPTEF